MKTNEKSNPLKKLIKSLPLIFVVVYLIVQFNFPLTDKKIIGKYVKSESGAPSLKSVTNLPDTIELFSNGTYSSGYHGNGTYEIDRGLIKTKINRKFNNNEDTFPASFTNKLFQNSKIMLNENVNRYYEKINKKEKRKLTMYIRQSPLCAATAHIRGRSLQAKRKKIIIIQINRLQWKNSRI